MTSSSPHAAKIVTPVAFALAAGTTRLALQQVETRYQIVIWWTLALMLEEVIVGRKKWSVSSLLPAALAATAAVLLVKLKLEGVQGFRLGAPA